MSQLKHFDVHFNCFRSLKRTIRAEHMVRAFVKIVGCVVVLLVAATVVATTASAVTLSYEYSGTGSVSFPSEAILNIGGSCSNPCAVSTLLTISGTGAAAGQTSGWAGQASSTISDNLGDHLILAVDAGNIGTNHTIAGGVFFPSVLPSTIDISTLSLASFLGGPGTIDYSLSIDLPNGAYVTPLPPALPLFAAGLGLLGLLVWRTKRKAAVHPNPLSMPV
jgi:hypothetical protein